MKSILSVAIVLIILSSCKEKNDHGRLAQFAVDEAIKVAGGDIYTSVHFEFDFRDRHYISGRQNGNFEYQRITKDSISETIDVYASAQKFKRIVNGNEAIVADSLARRIENSINSVNYFVLLPFGLNDDAVKKEYLGKSKIAQKDYHKIKVSFSQEGGGEDFDDIYVYWINTENYKIDFLAYSFQVNGGGMRFREAYNERYISGMRIVDYKNYKPRDKTADLFDLDVLFQSDGLELLSKIETENVVVNPLQ